LSQQWCDFFVATIGLIKLPHPEQRRARKSSGVWLMHLNIMREFRHYAIAPLSGFDLAAHVFAHAPVQIDQLGING
jgi:hypothetical protein